MSATEQDLLDYEDDGDYIVCDYCGKSFVNDGGGLYCSSYCEEAAEESL